MLIDLDGEMNGSLVYEPQIRLLAFKDRILLGWSPLFKYGYVKAVLGLIGPCLLGIFCALGTPNGVRRNGLFLRGLLCLYRFGLDVAVIELLRIVFLFFPFDLYLALRILLGRIFGRNCRLVLKFCGPLHG